jgi:hypothetical protein
MPDSLKQNSQPKDPLNHRENIGNSMLAPKSSRLSTKDITESSVYSRGPRNNKAHQHCTNDQPKAFPTNNKSSV